MQFLHLIFSWLKQITSFPEEIIESISFLPDFFKEALVDSINLVPFLFVIFVIIEIIEQYYAKKKHLFVFFIKKVGPLFGSLFASLPQCGFSVIASTIYTRRILSRGTLVSVYLATSDEAIPVLISEPSMAYLILPVILIKIVVAIVVGYLVDILITYKASEDTSEQVSPVEIEANTEGCCHHRFAEVRRKELLLHPLKHTFNIFVFILLVSVILGYILSVVGTEENMAKYCLMNSPLQPILVSIIGLIPNCAISVMLTILFIKHTISFGSLIAGLCSAGGLGMLVLLNKNRDKKDTVIIFSIMVIVSSIIGLILQYNLFNINSLFKIFGVEI